MESPTEAARSSLLTARLDYSRNSCSRSDQNSGGLRNLLHALDFFTATVKRPWDQEDIFGVLNGTHHFAAVVANASRFQRGPLKLIELLKRSSGHLSTQPHHRLYAILGLAKEGSRMVFIPDHSNPLERLSAELIKHIIERDGELDALHAYRTHRLQAPSWILQISRPAPEEQIWKSRVSGYRASGDLKACVQFSTELKRITIRVLVFDEISSCEGPFESKEQLCIKLLSTQEF